MKEIVLQAIELQSSGRETEAAELFRLVLQNEPNNPAAIYSLSLLLLQSGRLEDALKLIQKGVEVAPGFAPMWLCLGSILQALGQWNEALHCYEQSLNIDPRFLEALINHGVMLRKLLRHHEALERFNQALAIEPDNTIALSNAAMVYSEMKLFKESTALFDRLRKINPDHEYLLGLMVHDRMHNAEWHDFDELREGIINGLREGKRVAKSVTLMGITDRASDHYLAAKIMVHQYYTGIEKPLWRGHRYQHSRIRIAYISPDFREHPVGHAMAGIFEQHDRNRFDIIGVSLGVDDKSPQRTRIKNAFDQFIDASSLGTRPLAEMLRQMEVDIAVDIAGYTAEARPDLYLFRPAPVQINYLGYAGTLGLSRGHDFILADKAIIPPEHQAFYTERVIYLPGTYMPVDDKIHASATIPSRAELGLPDKGFVFCAFNHVFKILPEVWAVWMRLLLAVEGSVLWLSTKNPDAEASFRRMAKNQGIDPDRLVFAQRVPSIEDHLARYYQANLFLDTWPYNAHTTAADALRIGLPVLTYMGGAFPSRVAASLLYALDIPELVAHSLEEYETIAVSLATQPDRMSDLKKKLEYQVETLDVFDTEKFCRKLETAYLTCLEQVIY